MKKLLVRNLFWVNFVLLILPISFLTPAMQGLGESNPFIAISSMLAIGVFNFLAVMLIVFVLNGLHGKSAAIALFVTWIIVTSQGTIGLLVSVSITAGYWMYQKKYITMFSRKLSGASDLS
jgi:hypothetical protein